MCELSLLINLNWFETYNIVFLVFYFYYHLDSVEIIAKSNLDFE